MVKLKLSQCSLDLVNLSKPFPILGFLLFFFSSYFLLQRQQVHKMYHGKPFLIDSNLLYHRLYISCQFFIIIVLVFQHHIKNLNLEMQTETHTYLLWCLPEFSVSTVCFIFPRLLG